MAMPFDLETARKLRERNLIDEAVYNRIAMEQQPEMDEGGGGSDMQLAPAAPVAGPALPPQFTPDQAQALNQKIMAQPPDGGFNSAVNIPPVTAPQPTAPQPVPASPGKLAIEQMPMAQAGVPGAIPGLNLLAPYVGKIGSGYGAEQAGVRREANVLDAKGNETAAMLDRIQADDQAKIEAQEALEKTKEEEIERNVSLLNQKSEELTNAKINPGRLWAHMDTSDKILAGIGLFLGSFSHTAGNRAVEAIDTAIKRDISAQEAMLENKNKQLGFQRGILQDMITTFKDKRLAREAARVAYLKNAEIKISSIAQRYSGPEAQAKADQAIGAISQKRQAAEMAFMLKLQELINEQSLGAGAGGDPKLLERYVPGYGMALDKDRQKDFTSYIVDYERAKDGIEKLLKISQMSSKSISPSTWAEAATTAAMLKAALRTDIVGPGAVTDKEQAILDGIVADPTKLISLDSSNRTRLNTLLDSLKNNRNIRAKYYGLQTPDDAVGATPRN